ncbi:unnamed protein product [Auanema sp. JU1783]|nr:unnamed protein product [Auanema sp. JU1783]
MSVFERVREKANESKWSSLPYKGYVAGSPTDTFNEIVSMSFQDVNSNYNHAKHSRYEEMYTPYLGAFRTRKMYTSLAPSLCINYNNRSCNYRETPHKSYLPKQGEWLVRKDKDYRIRLPRNPVQSRAQSEPPAQASSRRCLTVPTSTTRVDNHFLYWQGRASGVKYISPFLQYPDHSIHEDRRYQRIFWSPEFINITPSCRHATHLMLSAY